MAQFCFQQWWRIWAKDKKLLFVGSRCFQTLLYTWKLSWILLTIFCSDDMQGKCPFAIGHPPQFVLELFIGEKINLKVNTENHVPQRLFSLLFIPMLNWLIMVLPILFIDSHLVISYLERKRVIVPIVVGAIGLLNGCPPLPRPIIGGLD